MFNNCIVFLCVIIACYAMAVNKAIIFVKRQKIKPRTLCTRFRDVSVDLFSRAASRQVFSALKSLTTVFGMGTGVPSS